MQQHLPFFGLHTLAKLPHCKLSPPHLRWLLAALACGAIDSNISAAESVTISIRMIWLPSPLTSQVQTPTILAVANFWSRINCRTHVAIARFRVVSFDREEALPTIGLLTQTTTGADANVWDDYISAFKGALCTNGYTSPLPQQTGTDYNSYLTGAQNLMRGRPDANAN